MLTRFFAFLTAVLLWPAGSLVTAQTISSTRLPDWRCGTAPPPLFMDGMEECGQCLYADPSLGSGGTYPGAMSISFLKDGNPYNYHLYVPTGYPFS